VPPLWPAAWLPAQVSLVPHLFSRTGAAGTDSRRRKEQLVRTLPIPIADFQLKSIGNWQLAIENGVSKE